MKVAFRMEDAHAVYQGDRQVCLCETATDALAITGALNKVTMPHGQENPNKSPAGFSLGDWHIHPEMPTMILEAALPQAKEIVAQVSTVGNARLVAAAPALFAALTTLKEDFADADGCYCGQMIGGTSTTGEPLGLCGHCKATAAIERVLGTSNAKPNEAEKPAGGKA